MAVSYLFLKLGVAFSIFAIIVIFGLYPLYSTSFSANKLLLSVMACFSGGLFLTLGLVHILPESQELLAADGPKNPILPVSCTIALCSYIFILFLDKVLMSPDEDLEELKESYFTSNLKQISIPPSGEEYKELVASKYKVARQISSSKVQHKKFCLKEEESVDINCPEEDCKVPLPFAKMATLHEEENHPLVKASRKDSEGHTHRHDEKHKTRSSVSAFMLLVAMGLHGIFSGLALGASSDKVQIIEMWIAMLIHKWSEALTVSISFVSAEVSREKSRKMIVFLALMTPLGILIGAFLASMSKMAAGICLALSAGTFLFISSAEIVVEEFNASTKKYYKFFAFCLGAALILFATAYEEAQ